MAAALGAMLLSSAWAQETQTQREPGERLRQRAGQAIAQAVQGQICLASKLQEMTVKDQAGKEFGKVQDLVIDQQGQVRYLAIAKQAGGQQAAQPQAGQRPGATEQPQQPAARGQQQAGQAGQAGQLTLVPWDVAEFHEGTTPAQSYVSLNIEAERLQQAPSFTEQQLTSKEGQQQWMAQVIQFYGRLRGAARPEFEQRRQEQPEQRQQPNPERDN